MAYEQSSITADGPKPMIAGHALFDKLVAFRVKGEWIGVDTGLEAYRWLDERWPGEAGPSHRRALAAVEAYLEDNGSAAAARAAFSVALMEAGLQIHVFEDRMAFLDFQIADATASDVKSAF